MPYPIVVLQSFPEPRPTTNPYVTMLRDALQALPTVDVLTFSWRRALTARYQVAHLHWPEILVRGRTPTRTAARQVLLLATLVRWRAAHVAVVRTRHNVATHERTGPTGRLLLTLVDRCTVADVVLNSATPVVPGRIRSVIPHGDYRPRYGALPRTTVVPGRLAFVGQIRAYKGVEHLLTTFAGLDSPGASLTVAGRPDGAEFADRLLARASGDPRIHLQLDHISDEELVQEITAAEVVVLPYREMHNSGGALTALSLDRPVLVPDNEVTRALADEVGDQWVLRYDGELDTADLRRALDAGRARPTGARPDLSHRAWDRTGRDHEEVYRAALRRVRRD